MLTHAVPSLSQQKKRRKKTQVILPLFPRMPFIAALMLRPLRRTKGPSKHDSRSKPSTAGKTNYARDSRGAFEANR